MTLTYILPAALVIAGWTVLFIISRRTIQRRCAQHRTEFDRQIEALSAQVRVLQEASDAATQEKSKSTSEGKDKDEATPLTGVSDEISPETVAMISQTITALLGRKIRVRSVKLLQTPTTTANSWAQQGRVVIQASHNLSQRGRRL
jgi:cytoskeletal protein RodZ